jgi:CheY-like chemotaxis protein
MKPFVLVVDDNVDTRCMAQFILKDDFEVIGASGGASALKLLGSFHPDVIVADLIMPVLDGLSFIKMVKRSIGCKDIPVIVLSGYAESYREQAIEAGAIVILKKPEGTLKLADTVKEALFISTTMESHSEIECREG